MCRARLERILRSDPHFGPRIAESDARRRAAGPSRLRPANAAGPLRPQPANVEPPASAPLNRQRPEPLESTTRHQRGEHEPEVEDDGTGAQVGTGGPQVDDMDVDDMGPPAE